MYSCIVFDIYDPCDRVVATMYITRTKKKVGTKEYQSILLVKSVRIEGKPRHETILNLTQWDDKQIAALEYALKGGGKKGEDEAKQGGSINLDEVEIQTGKGIGGVLVVDHLAKKLGIKEALGTTPQTKLAMALIAGRLLTQGSRLRLCEWQEMNELEATLGTPHFTEDDLYQTLDWLSENQAKIEARLFAKRYPAGTQKPSLFLYDITSSYLEGTENELAQYGYNRDGKKGKQQIVIGLLTDQSGIPVSIEVFEGNRSDSTTVISQVEKMAERFGVTEVVLVGDKGMIKRTQIKEFKENTHYITSITHRQIESLVKAGVIQMSLFENDLAEVEQDGIRYILRKNPIRAEEMAYARQSRIDVLQNDLKQATLYLAKHPKASSDIQLNRMVQKARRLHLQSFCEVTLQGRELSLVLDTVKQAALAEHDGCYALKTDLKADLISKEEVHARYKDLAKVEYAFRTIKTGLLELRPIFVRKESRTRGHVFVSMLAYMIAQFFSQLIKPLQLTNHAAWNYVDQLQTVLLSIPHSSINAVKKIQAPSTSCKAILDALALKIPNISFPPVA